MFFFFLGHVIPMAGVGFFLGYMFFKLSGVKTKQAMEFSLWIDQVKATAHNDGFVHDITNNDQWMNDYYKRGLTPAEAWDAYKKIGE